MTRQTHRFRSMRAFMNLTRALCGRPARDTDGRLVFPQPDILVLARPLRAPAFRLKRWAADLGRIPPHIQIRIVRLLGKTPAEPSWRRDRWLFAHGLPMENGEPRSYLIHTWAPRFRCRLVRVDEKTRWAVPGQGSLDLLSGVFYDGAGPAAIEFEWFDPVPGEEKMSKLMIDIIDALAAHKRAALMNPDAPARTTDGENRLQDSPSAFDDRGSSADSHSVR